MAKLHTTDEIISPFFTKEFADYLIESGYTISIVNNFRRHYTFSNQGLFCLMVTEDALSFFIWNEYEEDQRRGEYSLVHRFTGISSIKFFDFALLLHVMGAVSIPENFRKTNIANPSPLESFSSKIKMNLS